MNTTSLTRSFPSSGLRMIHSRYNTILRLIALAMALAGRQLNAPAQPVLVSTNPAIVSATAGGDSLNPIVSRDGRYVVFSSTAGNLATNTGGGPFPMIYPAKFNVFLYDRTNNTTTLVSVNTSGTAGGNGDSFAVAISTNGQFVLFESAANNLGGGDANNANDVFVRDVVNGVTTLVSISVFGPSGNGESRSATMTPDGRYVAFVSAASDLVADDNNNGIQDVFVRDLQAGTTVLASVGAQSSSFGNLSSSEAPEISDNGQYVAFFSTAVNLIAGVNTTSEIYVRDLVNNVTTLASANAYSIAVSSFNTDSVACSTHVMSADGQYVAFVINAKTVTPAYPSGVLVRYHVFTGATDIVNTNALGAASGYQNYSRSIDMSSDGNFITFVTNNFATSNTALPDALWVWNAQFNSTTLVAADPATNSQTVPDFYSPQISDDGRYVSFFSSVTNLTTNAMSTNGGNLGFHLYTCDTQSNTRTMVDPRLNGSAAGYASPDPQSVSASGRVIVFDSYDAGLVTNDANRGCDVFIRDLTANTLAAVSVPNPALLSRAPNGPSLVASQSMSTNGRYFAFTSEAENLVTNDTNFCRDVFVHDRLTGANTLVSVATNGYSGNNLSSDSAISADGRYVAFTSSASNLVTIDSNAFRDVFVRDLQANTTTLVSVNTTGNGSGNADSYSPIIDATGRYVVFHSRASNLAPGFSTTNSESLFRRDLQTHTTFALLTNTAGQLVVAAVSPNGRYVAHGGVMQSSYVWDMQVPKRIYTNTTAALAVAISPDGSRFAYATSLITSGQIFLVNIASRTSTLLSGFAASSNPTLQFSADSRYLLFGSGGSGKSNQIVLYDSQTGQTNVVSTAYNSSGGANTNSDWATISPDGHFIAYRSIATDIVTNDFNGNADIFLYNRLTGQTTLASVSGYGNFSASNHSFAPVFSPDSQTLLFTSWASDIASQDFNQSGDVYALSLTDPSSPPPVIVTFTPPATISWNVAAGINYQAQFKTNLTDATWQPVNGTVTVFGSTAYLTDLSPSPAQKFYRVAAH